MTPREKLHALPKAALVDLALSLASERNTARAEARQWKRRAVAHRGAAINADQVRVEAQAILDAIGPDPDADDHLAELAHAIGPRTSPIDRPRKAGPRCRKGTKFCGRPLDEHGLCTRHDFKARRALGAVA